MKFVTKTLVLGLVMIGGIALAEATDPDVKARQALMDANGGAMKVLSTMAKGDVAFDAAAAEAAKQTLVTNAAGIEAAWAKNATDPASHSSPEIWNNMPDFLTHAAALSTAATALDTSSLDGVRAGIEGIGGSCGGCHKAYKTS